MEVAAADRRWGARRLRGVDAARGAALLGMMAVHVFPGTDPDGTTSTPYLIASGRSAAAFAVLAGAGLALATGGVRPPTGRAWLAAAAATAARAAVIAGVGLLLGVPDSGVAVILVYYGVLFLFAAPLLDRRAPRLAVTALAAAVVVPVLSHLLRPGLPPPSRANPTLPAVLADPGPWLVELTVTGYYPALAWTAYLAAGLAAGRLALRSPRVAAGLLAGGAALAVAAVAASSLLLGPLGGADRIGAVDGIAPGQLGTELAETRYGSTPTSTWWWLAVDAPHTTTPLDLLHTTGTALALLGGMLLLARVAGPLLAPLAAAGGMTLTLYTVHVLALSSGLLPADPVTSYVGQVLVFLVLATVWRRLAGRGPLEALVARAAARARRAVEEPQAGRPDRAGNRRR